MRSKDSHSLSPVGKTGVAGAADVVDLTRFTFDAARFAVTGTEVMVSIAGDENLVVPLDGRSGVRFADRTVTVLSADHHTKGDSTGGTFVGAGSAFALEIRGNGSLDWSYEIATHTLTVENGLRTDESTVVAITDLGDELTLTEVVLNAPLGSFTTNAPIDAVVFTGPGAVDTLACARGIRNLSFANGLENRSTIRSDVSVLEVEGDVSAHLVVFGRVGRAAIAGSLVAGATFSVTDDVEHLSLARTGDRSAIEIGGTIDRLEIGGDSRACVIVGKSLKRLAVEGDLAAGGAVSVSENLGEVDVRGSVGQCVSVGASAGAITGTLLEEGARLAVSGNLGGLTMTDGIGVAGSPATIEVGGDAAGITSGGSVHADITIRGQLTAFTTMGRASVHGTIHVAGMHFLTVGGDLEADLQTTGPARMIVVAGDVPPGRFEVRGDTEVILIEGRAARDVAVIGDLDVFHVTDDFSGVLGVHRARGKLSISDGDVHLEHALPGPKHVIYDGSTKKLRDLAEPATVAMRRNPAVSSRKSPTSWEIVADSTDDELTYAWPEPPAPEPPEDVAANAALDPDEDLGSPAAEALRLDVSDPPVSGTGKIESETIADAGPLPSVADDSERERSPTPEVVVPRATEETSPAIEEEDLDFPEDLSTTLIAHSYAVPEAESYAIEEDDETLVRMLDEVDPRALEVIEEEPETITFDDVEVLTAADRAEASRLEAVIEAQEAGRLAEAQDRDRAEGDWNELIARAHTEGKSFTDIFREAATYLYGPEEHALIRVSGEASLEEAPAKIELDDDDPNVAWLWSLIRTMAPRA